MADLLEQQRGTTKPILHNPLTFDQAQAQAVMELDQQQRLELRKQIATYALMGPTLGEKAAPTFRAIALTDLPRMSVAKLPVVPACKARRTSAQLIQTATATPIAWPATDDYDTDSMHNPSSNSQRITITTPGLYHFETAFHFGASALGNDRLTWFDIDGGGLFWAPQFVPPHPTRETTLHNHLEISLTAGQYVEVYCQQDSGGAINVASNGGYLSYFAAHWIGPAS